MAWNRSKTLSGWVNYFANRYTEFIKESRSYRYKIIGIEMEQESNEAILSVMIVGIKNQIIKYLPRDIVVNDIILKEFSPFDVRTITFYALQQDKIKHLASPPCLILGQEFSNGKTVFILNKLDRNGNIRKSAQELYSDTNLLNQFNRRDLINIISTAIQEQTIEDLYNME